MVKKLEVSAIPSELKDVREFIQKIGEEINCSENDLFDIQLVVGEAASNAIEHGSHPDSDKIFLTAIWDKKARELIIKIKDQGESFANENYDNLSLANDLERGRGLVIISKLVDNYYFNKEKDGKTISLTKKIA